MYGYLADFIVAVHVGYVGFVVLGQLAIWIGWALGRQWVRNLWFRLTHLVMMAVVVFEQIMNIRCPLSVWEERFRALAGQETTSETFLGRILHNLIFIEAKPWVFDVLYFGFGSIILLTLILCPPRRKLKSKVKCFGNDATIPIPTVNGNG
jgi:hypothetical protein